MQHVPFSVYFSNIGHVIQYRLSSVITQFSSPHCLTFRAVITEHHRLECLNSRNVHGSRGQSQGLCPGEASLCPHMSFSVTGLSGTFSVCSSYNDTSSIGLGLIPKTFLTQLPF